MKIFKYTIEPDAYIEMPNGARILSVQVQNGVPVLWALVDPDAPLKRRDIRVYGTGHSIRLEVEDLEYLGTFQMHDGALVFHAFEVLPRD